MGAPVGRNEIPTWTTLGVRLRALRHERGLPQARLADLAGVHSESVSRWELGKELPSLSALGRVAIAIDIEDLGELLAGVQAGDVLG